MGLLVSPVKPALWLATAIATIFVFVRSSIFIILAIGLYTPYSRPTADLLWLVINYRTLLSLVSLRFGIVDIFDYPALGGCHVGFQLMLMIRCFPDRASRLKHVRIHDDFALRLHASILRGVHKLIVEWIYKLF